MKTPRASALPLVLALFFPAPARAAKVVAVLSADHGVYRRALDGFEAAFGSTVTVRLASGDAELDSDTRLVVAIGGRAAMRTYPPQVAVVYCLAPSLGRYGPRAQATRVRTVPRPEDLLARIQASQPQARRLAVLWSHPNYQDYVEGLAAQASKSGLQVLSIEADSDALPRALRRLEGRADAVWLAPDPLLVTPANFRLIKAFARAAKLVFYAPTAELVQEGATAAVIVSPEEMGRSAAEAARRALAGEASPSEVYGRRVEMIVDPARASEAGLSLSTDVVKMGALRD